MVFWNSIGRGELPNQSLCGGQYVGRASKAFDERAQPAVRILLRKPLDASWRCKAKGINALIIITRYEAYSGKRATLAATDASFDEIAAERRAPATAAE